MTGAGRRAARQLMHIPIRGAGGRMVPLGAIARHRGGVGLTFGVKRLLGLAQPLASIALDPELDGTPPLRLPERGNEAIQRMLGFAIGDRWPIMPQLLPAEPIAHTDAAPRPP